jgi:hypothetical protein
MSKSFEIIYEEGSIESRRKRSPILKMSLPITCKHGARVYLVRRVNSGTATTSGRPSPFPNTSQSLTPFARYPNHPAFSSKLEISPNSNTRVHSTECPSTDSTARQHNFSVALRGWHRTPSMLNAPSLHMPGSSLRGPLQFSSAYQFRLHGIQHFRKVLDALISGYGSMERRYLA